MDNNIVTPLVIDNDNSQVLSANPQNKSPKQSKSFLVICILISAILFGSGGFYLGKNSNKYPNNLIPTPTNSKIKACTMEAKICPDGSSVGRTGPNCEFAPCPTVGPTVGQNVNCTDYSVRNLNEAQSYKDEYKKLNSPEVKFEGILEKYPERPKNIATTLMRENTYKLNGIGIETRDDLSAYVDKSVIITGRNHNFQLEGENLLEIIPVNITCK